MDNKLKALKQNYKTSTRKYKKDFLTQEQGNCL